MLNIGVLASGRGSNLQAIINACQKGEVPAKVEVVISDKPGAYALLRSKSEKIDAVYIDPKNAKNTYEMEIVNVLKKHNVDLVCLAGYMRIIGDVLLSSYSGKIINIHPSLLPSFPGLNAQRQALERGVKISGATVHLVDEGCDTGPIILQASVPVLENDTEETLSVRILEQEHKIYPQAIKLIAEGKVKVERRRVRIL